MGKAICIVKMYFVVGKHTMHRANSSTAAKPLKLSSLSMYFFLFCDKYNAPFLPLGLWRGRNDIFLKYKQEAMRTI